MKKSLYLNPLFLCGLAIKIALICLCAPKPVTQWFAPFLELSIEHFSWNPWGEWLNNKGSSLAFPYGYVMWLIFLPLSAAFHLAGLSLLKAYGFTLLAVDIALLRLLTHFNPQRDKLILTLYWLSPIVIAATYLQGYNDLIPALFLTYSLYFLSQHRLIYSGLHLALAISAKFSMALALPFYIIYLLHNRPTRQYSYRFTIGFVTGFLAFQLPFILGHDGLFLLASNPEVAKVFQLHIALTSLIKIYLVPLSYLIILYVTWRVKRINFNLFQSMLGLSFLIVVLLTPASPGWLIWAIPALINYQLMSGYVAILLTTFFSTLYVISSLILTPSSLDTLGALFPLLFDLPKQIDVQIASIAETLLIAAGLILAARIWRESILKNDFFRLSRKPFVIGIAGDSGAGKDTLVEAITGLFGNHSVTSLSGDDYHLWDRQKPMWQAITHLNPMANNLEAFTNDLIKLIDRKSIAARHYNHDTGKMSRLSRKKSNDIIISSGLHALYLPILRDCYNFSIYLDIDESLRRHFKIKRDTTIRGHSLDKVLQSIERREPDSEKFIRPQSRHADLVLSLQPVNHNMLDITNSAMPIKLKLVATSRNGLNEPSLMRILIGICGMHVDIDYQNEKQEVTMTIEGESSAEDIELAASLACPNVLSFLDLKPKWQQGMLGLMQLFTLCHINQALSKRMM